MVVNGARQIRNRRRRDARTQKKAKGFEKMRSLAGLIVSKPVRLRVAVQSLIASPRETCSAYIRNSEYLTHPHARVASTLFPTLFDRKSATIVGDFLSVLRYIFLSNRDRI